jgi:predicted rRNA methylase YqxC with S4 and FtsJ domains
MCAGASVHNRHNVEALDVAQRQIQSQLKSSLSVLQTRRSNLEGFVENVKKQESRLKEVTVVGCYW